VLEPAAETVDIGPALADMGEGLAIRLRIVRQVAAAPDDEEKVALDPRVAETLDDDVVEGRAAGAENERVGGKKSLLLASDGDRAEKIEPVRPLAMPPSSRTWSGRPGAIRRAAAASCSTLASESTRQ